MPHVRRLGPTPLDKERAVSELMLTTAKTPKRNSAAVGTAAAMTRAAIPAQRVMIDRVGFLKSEFHGCVARDQIVGTSTKAETNVKTTNGFRPRWVAYVGDGKGSNTATMCMTELINRSETDSPPAASRAPFHVAACGEKISARSPHPDKFVAYLQNPGAWDRCKLANSRRSTPEAIDAPSALAMIA